MHRQRGAALTLFRHRDGAAGECRGIRHYHEVIEAGQHHDGAEGQRRAETRHDRQQHREHHHAADDPAPVAARSSLGAVDTGERTDHHDCRGDPARGREIGRLAVHVLGMNQECDQPGAQGEEFPSVPGIAPDEGHRRMVPEDRPEVEEVPIPPIDARGRRGSN